MTDTYDSIHMSVPPPSGPVCDFCSLPDVRWSYPCRDHNVSEEFLALVLRQDESHVEDATIENFQYGGWAACNVCHALIERSDRERLAKRSAKRMTRNYGRQGIIIPLSESLHHVRRMHDAFWSNREGPAIAYTGGGDPTQ